MKVFLCKVVDSNDRDCVAYVELKDIKNKHICCDGHINIHGACYSMSFGGRYFNYQYEEVKTILTKEEYESLKNPTETIDWNSIFDKLMSEENDELFEIVSKEEKEYLMDVYELDEDDVDFIFNEYALNYQDRGIVSYIFDDVYQLGYEEAYNFGYIQRNSPMENYFDFEKFGEDLLEEEQYLRLDDGRCVFLNYEKSDKTIDHNYRLCYSFCMCCASVQLLVIKLHTTKHKQSYTTKQ